MTDPQSNSPEWNFVSWKEARRQQHQEFQAIPFSRKLEIIEEMNRAGVATMNRLRARGLPYIDPYTGERVPADVAGGPVCNPAGGRAKPSSANPENSES